MTIMLNMPNATTMASHIHSTSNSAVDEVNDPTLEKLCKPAFRFLALINNVTAVNATVP